MLRALHPQTGNPTVVVLAGRDAVLEQSPLLENLAARCDQPGAMNWLRYFLSGQSAKRKHPWLVLLTRAGAYSTQLQLDDVWAAVLFSEYRVLGVPTKAFSTNDLAGMRTVVAPVEWRQAAAAMAIEALMARGAHSVLVSYDNAGRESGRPAGRWGRNMQWAMRRRATGQTLLLAETYDATLAKLGKKTRFNLRYYRKRLLKRMPAEFIEDVRGMLSDADLIALNAASLNPIEKSECLLQYESACRLPGGFLLGLRGAEGEWLSLLGGWRQGDRTVMHWQINAEGYEKDSLCTVMRSFFVEHEVLRGTRGITFYGGTPHSMAHSFEQEETWDLVVRRKSLKAAAFQLAASLFASPQGLTRRINFLARTLCVDDLEWHTDSRKLAKAFRPATPAPGIREPFARPARETRLE